MSDEIGEMSDQEFARRMSRHMEELANTAVFLAGAEASHSPDAPRVVRLLQLAGDMRALGRIMYKESIPRDDNT